MLTLLGSLLGFLFAAFPDLLKLWRDSADRKQALAMLDRADRKQELAMLNGKIESQRLDHAQLMEEIRVHNKAAESKPEPTTTDHKIEA